jgi:hypothetical protein
MAAAAIPLRIVEDDPGTRWEAEVGEELATPFNPNGAPLVRAVFIQGITPPSLFLYLATQSQTAFRLHTQSVTRFRR